MKISYEGVRLITYSHYIVEDRPGEGNFLRDTRTVNGIHLIYYCFILSHEFGHRRRA
jgi:hypothetical protein